MNITGRLRLHFLLVLLQCLNMTKVSVSGLAPCTSASFSRSIGYILHGFLLGDFEVGDLMECKKRCIISENCLSLNILTNPNGRPVCQLNSGRKEDGVREQFVQHGAGQYYGLKEKKMCSNNGDSCDNVTPWYAFNQSYFQYVRIGRSHSGAQKYCEEQNGGLASISSEKEQTFLHELFLLLENEGAEYFRIGMNDIAKEGVFVWDDGSPVTYTRFLRGEPSNGNGEDCMLIYKEDGGLMDGDCGSGVFFMCETDYSKLFS